MAKKPKKASAEPGEGAAEAAPKGKKKLVMIAAAAILVVGGGAGFVLMRGGHGEDAKAEGGHGEAAVQDASHGSSHGSSHGGGSEERKPVVFLDLRELIINLTPDPGQEKGKFAKMRVALELKDAKVEEEVKPLTPRIEDTFQVYMRDLRPGDLSGSAGLYRLREELLRRVNVAVYPAKVDAVLFKDMIIQ